MELRISKSEISNKKKIIGLFSALTGIYIPRLPRGALYA